MCSLRCDLARGRFTGEVCFFYGNGGVQSAGAWRLCLTRLTCLTCLTRWVRHCIPRGFAVPLCGWVWVQIYRWGVPGFFYGNGGVRVAWAWRLHKTYKTYKTYKIMMGAPVFALMCTPKVGHN